MFEIRQDERYEGDDWWKWSVWVEGSDNELDRIAFVEWILHPTFPNPVRKVGIRQTKFRLDTGGWGVFPIIARIQMQDGSQIQLDYFLQLHYPDGTMNYK